VIQALEFTLIPMFWTRSALTERVACGGDVEWVEAGLGGERDQQIIVTRHIVEHASKEIRLARCGADHVGPDAGCGEKRADSRTITGDESKRLNRQ